MVHTYPVHYVLVQQVFGLLSPPIGGYRWLILAKRSSRSKMVGRILVRRGNLLCRVDIPKSACQLPFGDVDGACHVHGFGWGKKFLLPCVA